MITNNEKEFILNEMKNLLDEYDYNYSTWSLDNIVEEWAKQKADLIEMFKKHPNYIEGKFLIAFVQDYEREISRDTILNFKNYICMVLRSRIDTLPKEIEERRIAENCSYLPMKLYDLFEYDFHHLFNERVISEDTATYLNKIIPQIYPHTGQKTSRVVNKICQYLNYDKDADYNREFAKFADALSPMKIKRHTILSINPLDYLTMSFGNSWSSCHTIDKENRRHMPNSYEGAYSSGTMSYMLDKTSMVFYTIDSSYNGSDYWTQPKINRQMFHYGEDKLVQSRLYPQSNDGFGDAYSQYRNIVQATMAEILNIPNLWKLSRGINNVSKYILSEGTHYRDYRNFEDCTLSKVTDSTNEEYIVVGAKPICISCGSRHDVEDNIDCCYEVRYCEHCGRTIRNEDDEYWVGDYCYCHDCVTYCEVCGEYELNDDVYWVEDEKRYVCRDCIDRYYYKCPHCYEFVHENNAIYIECEGRYVCPDCADNCYYVCVDCGEYFPEDRIHEDEFGDCYCDDCYKEEEEE